MAISLNDQILTKTSAMVHFLIKVAGSQHETLLKIERYRGYLNACLQKNLRAFVKGCSYPTILGHCPKQR